MLASGLLGATALLAQPTRTETITPGPSIAAQQMRARHAALLDGLAPVTDATLLHPGDDDWLMWRRTYDGWGYSPLDQVNRENVRNLRLVWSWSLNPGASETTPLVYHGVLFVHNNGDKIDALDAATGDLLWEYNRKLTPEILATNSIWLTKRNMAIYQDKLISATSDGHIIALNVKTGAVIWDIVGGAYEQGWRYTGGPLVANGVIVQSMSGCGDGQEGGCFIAGYDPEQGRELWRVHTVAQDGKAGDSWNGMPLSSRFGGSAWNAGSYDPELGLVYYGDGQPYGWAAVLNGLLPASRKKGTSSDALFTDTTFAIEPKTGKLRWYFQHLPMDTWDLDYAYERVLVDQPVDGKMRKQVVTVGKLGIIESLDRGSGKFLWSKETVPQNVVLSIDQKTGRKTINQEVIPQVGKTTMNCPADPGGRGWPATAYSPLTGTLYLPLNEFCANATVRPLQPGQSAARAGGISFVRHPVPNSDGNIGRLDAIKLTDHAVLWSDRQRAPMTSAVLPTAGHLLFAGDLDRYFRAYDDTSGKVLWQARLNNVVNSYPIAFRVDGKEYIAVVAGSGSTLPRALGGMTPEIAGPQAGSALWVFALDDGR
ncbi:MAG TPA: PQQ-binding-like beta-propeller repeat protein [Rhizomicrobium sp.]|nr:PQQ-binding-like beta-propeller repeat protein [Rhizomicrobium sp.]